MKNILYKLNNHKISLILIMVLYVFISQPFYASAATESLLQVKTPNDTKVYFVNIKKKIKKAYTSEKAFFSYNNKWSDIKVISAQELKKWNEVKLIKTASSPTVYYITNGKKASITREDDLHNYKLDHETILTVSEADLNSYKTTDYSTIGLRPAASSAEAINNSGIVLATSSPSIVNDGRVNLFIYPNTQTTDKLHFIKGQKNIKVASFIAEVPADSNVIINDLFIRNFQTDNINDGFKNLKVSINGRYAKNTIETPSGGAYYFYGFNSQIRGGTRIKIEVYIDSNVNAVASQLQYSIAGIGVTNKNNGLSANLPNLNIASQVVKFIQPKLEIYLMNGGVFLPTGKKNVVGTLYVKNTGDDDLRLDSLFLQTNSDGFTSSLGYTNLSLSTRGTAQQLGSIYQPIAGSNLVSLNKYKLRQGAEAVIAIKIDTTDVATTSFQMFIQNIQFENNANNKIIQPGDINNRVYVNYLESQTDDQKIASQPPLIWPTSNKTINYYFNDPLYPFQGTGGGHQAMDISASQGNIVYAAATGTVIALQDDPDQYDFVTIQHDNNITTTYGHLSKIKVKVGDVIGQGKQIGNSGGKPGTPGAGQNTTGPHLHFEVTDNGVLVDPIFYFK